ncbi:MAG: hypothetical protein IT262_15215 [Saprospiraceae bacterium]|nr:hypothetical protein [Saprospiraceae bacterium]
MNIRPCSLLLGLLLCQNLPAQVLSGVSSRWSDSFVEWEIFIQPEIARGEEEPPPEEQYGELKLRWLNVRDDWSEWDFELGGGRGTIKQRWKEDPSQWELRTYEGDIVTMRTAWPGDFGEWRVTDNNVTLSLKSRWTNQFDEWLVQDASRGRFYLYTVRSQDPRDWVIEDELDETVSQPMRLALIFLTIYNASPKL